MMFRVGMKVVCVNSGAIIGDASSHGEWLPGEAIVEGEIYTIASLFSNPNDSSAMVRLHEVRRHSNTVKWWGHDGYGAERFRPIQTTDISIFTAMLNTSKTGVEA